MVESRKVYGNIIVIDTLSLSCTHDLAWAWAQTLGLTMLEQTSFDAGSLSQL